MVSNKDSVLLEGVKKACEVLKSGDINGFTCTCK